MRTPAIRRKLPSGNSLSRRVQMRRASLTDAVPASVSINKTLSAFFVCSTLFFSGCENIAPDDIINAYNNSMISTYGQGAASSHGLLVGSNYGMPVQSATPSANPPPRVAANAAHCVSYSGNPASTAFFKGSVTNNCSKTVWVSYCAIKDCQSSANFYNSAVTLKPGQRQAADLDGRGIRYAACFYSEPHYDTPTVTNRTNGAYNCN